MKKLPEALTRLLIVFAVFICGIFLLRFILPATLKDTKMHIRATIEKETLREKKYAGSSACKDCHDEYNVKKEGYHRNLSCETCHGPAQRHVENPQEVKPEVPQKREFCILCHAYNLARPTGFPQINPVLHNPLKPCATCHNPHDPKPPQVPTECVACHGEISRTKAISPHVQIECTTCHTVPEEHKVTPRAVRPTIPQEREFCGKCHGKESDEKNASVKDTPKVDLSTHGEKYLCWQCHYPHMPEVE